MKTAPAVATVFPSEEGLGLAGHWVFGEAGVTAGGAVMARRKQQGLEAKQARAEALVRELKALRVEIAEEEKALRRERADQALQRLERLGLAEALLGLEEVQCQQVEQANGVGLRFQILARFFGSPSVLEGLAEGNDQRVGSAPSPAVPQGGSMAGSEEQRRGLFR